MPIKNRAKKSFATNQEHIKFVFREGYKIFPITDDNKTYKIRMIRGHQQATLDETYTYRDIDWGISELYRKLYERQNK